MLISAVMELWVRSDSCLTARAAIAVTKLCKRKKRMVLNWWKRFASAAPCVLEDLR